MVTTVTSFELRQSRFCSSQFLYLPRRPNQTFKHNLNYKWALKPSRPNPSSPGNIISHNSSTICLLASDLASGPHMLSYLTSPKTPVRLPDHSRSRPFERMMCIFIHLFAYTTHTLTHACRQVQSTIQFSIYSSVGEYNQRYLQLNEIEREKSVLELMSSFKQSTGLDCQKRTCKFKDEDEEEIDYKSE